MRGGRTIARALVLVALPMTAASAEPATDAAPASSASEIANEARTRIHRWHLPTRDARELHRDASGIDADDWNPLARPARAAKTFLRGYRVTTDLSVLFLDQWASAVRTGQQNYGSFVYRGMGDLALVKGSSLGSSYLQWNLTGTVGLDYDQATESLSSNAGIISVVDANLYPDTAAIDELFWKQVSPSGDLVLLVGRVDQSFHFDTNRVANDSIRQLLSYSLGNNLSIPWPLYGGLGGLVRWKVRDGLALMLGAADSSSSEPWGFWKSVDDGSWYQLAEIDLTAELPVLGKGHYRITPWHNRLAGEEGWGVGINFDQELGRSWLVSFFRFGIGDPDVTPVRTFVSGGLAVERPFGRKGDYVAIGMAWSRPSPGQGVRDETTLELVYRFRVTSTIGLSPDLQLVFDPARNPGDDLVVVPGVRLALDF